MVVLQRARDDLHPQRHALEALELDRERDVLDERAVAAGEVEAERAAHAGAAAHRPLVAREVVDAQALRQHAEGVDRAVGEHPGVQAGAAALHADAAVLAVGTYAASAGGAALRPALRGGGRGGQPADRAARARRQRVRERAVGSR